MSYEADPAAAAALVAHLDEFTDPAELYARASSEQALLDAAAQLATGHKARALAMLWQGGMSYGQIAALPWVAETRSGVQKLVEQGRAVAAGTGVWIGMPITAEEYDALDEGLKRGIEVIDGYVVARH
ncbi:hypothetical protein [Acrocarpospora sp. B8E8]|uniref:hypothetical protein n=1 Tax=Acrocarpospora sp. B8E8 TaxID=3153572 RepID=UPI00325CF2C9